MRDLASFVHEESGATAVEYALIISATAMALIAVMPGIGSKLQAVFSSVASGWL